MTIGVPLLVKVALARRKLLARLFTLSEFEGAVTGARRALNEVAEGGELADVAEQVRRVVASPGRHGSLLLMAQGLLRDC